MLCCRVPLSVRTRFFASITLATLLLSAVVATVGVAEPTSTSEARAAVATWLRVSPRPLDTCISQEIRNAQTYLSPNGEILYHVVSLSPSGFVIVAGDDLVEPIIAFSKSGEFDPSPKNPLGAIVSRDLPLRVARARASVPDEHHYPGGIKGVTLLSAAPVADSAFLRAKQKWARLSGFGMSSDVAKMQKTAVSDVRVPPLVKSKWSQDLANGAATYNFYTPPFAAGAKENYVCGCVATAMAQLMRFHEHPDVGVGTGSFKILVDEQETTRRLRGGNGLGGPYSWSDMPLVPEEMRDLSETQRKAIGALTHDAGVASHMQYSAEGSGAYSADAKAALLTTFKYSNAVFGYDYENGLTEALKPMMNANLDAGFPVLLGIGGGLGGHEIVGDGYGYDDSTLYHHLNLGWAGDADAWYNLPNIDVYGDGNASFDVVDECIYNVFPTGSGEIISGRVVDDQDKPMQGAVVTAVSGSNSFTSTTSAEGVYGISKLTSDTEFVVVPKKSGWSFTSQTVRVGKSADGGNSGNKDSIDFRGEQSSGGALTVTIDQAAEQLDPTDRSPVLFTVEFSASVTGFENNDVILSGTAEPSAATVKGEGRVYTVEVRGMTRSGTVIASVVEGAATDESGNTNSESTSTDNVVEYKRGDNEGPTVTVEQAAGQPDPTSSGPIRFVASFNRTVTGFTSSDVVVTGTAGASSAVVGGSGRTYTIYVSGMKRSGTVTASVPAGAAVDEMGRGNSESVSIDNTVTYNRQESQLTVVVNQAEAQPDPARTWPIRFIAEFSQPVSDFTAEDVRVGGTAGGAKTISLEGSGNRYVILVKNLTKAGTVEVWVPAGVAHNSLGQPNAASTSTDNVVTFDTSVTGVRIDQAEGQDDPARSQPIRFTVEFQRPVTGFSAEDVKITGTARGEKRVSVTGSGAEYTVEVSGLTSSGTVTAYIPRGAATDSIGGLTAASTSTDNTVLYKSVPTVTINQALGQRDPTKADRAFFTVLFSRHVNGFSADDVVLTGEAAEGAKVSVRGSGGLYSVQVYDVVHSGTLSVSIPAEAARDEFGVPNTASTSEDNTVTFVR